MEFADEQTAVEDKQQNGGGEPMKNKPKLVINHSSNIDDISTPSDLKFDEEVLIEDSEISEKIKEIENCLTSPDTVPLEKWQNLARSKGGLISDGYRRRIWPRLLEVSPCEMTEPPALHELTDHPEYNQVVLDVGRSLKRFPPGVPIERRLALQDQLTALILRVMRAYPDLKYYQGYHDVAITLLLVCGARAAFPLLCRLSAAPDAPLRPFMQPDMKPTQHRLNYMLPLLRRVNPALADHLQRAEVGTMFALPWFLTWFGHSLPRYADVVRLYDFFLCAPPLMPVYVTAALVLHRAPDVLAADCDMATLHCLLSRIPDAVPWEEVLAVSGELVARHPAEGLAGDVAALERGEERQRAAEEARRAARVAERERAARARAGAAWRRAVAARLRGALPPRLLLAAAAALLGVYVYYRPELLFSR